MSSGSSQSNEAPVIFVGKYLEHLCFSSSVAGYFLKSRSQPNEEKEILPVSKLIDCVVGIKISLTKHTRYTYGAGAS